MMSIYILQTILPLALILWLAVLPPRNLAGFGLLGIAAALVTLVAALQGVWVFPPWWVPYSLAVMLVAAVTLRLIRTPVRPVLPTEGAGWLTLAALAGVVGLAGAQAWAALAARPVPEGPAIDLGWPLASGTYLVANGGASPSINAHAALLDPSHPLHASFGGSGYAVDLIAVNRWGFRTSGIMPADPAAYAIFSAPVLAPCAGQVVLAIDGHPDMPIPEVDEENPAGNHVVLHCNGIDVLLAHLRQGHVQVAAGDSVVPGQQLGEVGNSGNTGEPHLHIHAQLPGTPDSPFSGAAVPIRVQGRFLLRNALVDIPMPAHP